MNHGEIQSLVHGVWAIAWAVGILAFIEVVRFNRDHRRLS